MKVDTGFSLFSSLKERGKKKKKNNDPADRLRRERLSVSRGSKKTSTSAFENLKIISNIKLFLVFDLWKARGRTFMQINCFAASVNHCRNNHVWLL